MAERAPIPSMEDYARAQDTLDFLVGMVEAEAMARRAARQPGTDIPVVVIAGFLGAGKTTLMRHLLTGRHGLRIAALVNDFAALNIDAALIADVSGDTMALDNGCICCSQSGGAARALIGIAERPGRPEMVLIEASGVADPWSIGQVADAVPGVALDCVVTVVDASACASDPSIDFLLARQVTAADIILLNKTDLVVAAEADAASAHLSHLAPKAQILRTVECAVPHAVILDSGRRQDASADVEPASTDGMFASVTLTATGPVERGVLERCLSKLPEGIFRVKGFVRLTDNPETSELLQSVGRRWRWHRRPSRQGTNQLVLIGLVDAVRLDNVAKHFAPAGLRPA